MSTSDVSYIRVGKCGRKKIQVGFARVCEIPLHQRQLLGLLLVH